MRNPGVEDSSVCARSPIRGEDSSVCAQSPIRGGDSSVCAQSPIRGRVLLAGVGLLWVIVIAVGGRALFHYENAPGPSADAPRQWPSASRIQRPDARFALVMLAHPNCPCTRASLAELEVVMAKLQGKVAAYVIFSKPDASTEEIRNSDLWTKASAIPDVITIADDHGAETKRFGGLISGQAMLYDPQGHLVFSGGVTAARGHQGDNAGVDAVVSRVRGEVTAFAHAPAFGCSLYNPDAQELKEKSLWK
jgi:hypothetical protein